MHPSSSSTSSSRPWRDALLTGLWTLVALAAIDAAINWVFAYPADPTVTRPGRLQQYFEYGRSIEGKVRRMVGPSVETSAAVTVAGWPDDGVVRPTKPEMEGGILLAAYGQSFTNNACAVLREMEPGITLRLVGGPGAPLNYAYHRYLRDGEGRREAKVVVLGIVAETFWAMDTLTAMTWNFERPPSFTYPRFELNDGQLAAEMPEIPTFGDLRQALADPSRWGSFVRQLSEHDAFYDPLVFEANWTDHSALCRLVRRGWGQRHHHLMVGRYHDDAGFRPDTDLLPVAEAILRRFVEQVRGDGRLPLVLLFNNRGYGDHLYRALGPLLDDLHVDYVSTHAYAPATARANFLPDGHFVPEVRRQTAARMAAILRDHTLLPGGGADPR